MENEGLYRILRVVVDKAQPLELPVMPEGLTEQQAHDEIEKTVVKLAELIPDRRRMSDRDIEIKYFNTTTKRKK